MRVIRINLINREDGEPCQRRIEKAAKVAWSVYLFPALTRLEG